MLWWSLPDVQLFWCFIVILMTLWIEIYGSAFLYVLSRHLTVVASPVGPLSYGVPFCALCNSRIPYLPSPGSTRIAGFPCKFAPFVLVYF